MLILSIPFKIPTKPNPLCQFIMVRLCTSHDVMDIGATNLDQMRPHFNMT
jgi:hypothetical protein